MSLYNIIYHILFPFFLSKLVKSSYFGTILGTHNQTPMALVQGVVSWRQRHGFRASDEATVASATPSRLLRLALSELWRDGGRSISTERYIAYIFKGCRPCRRPRKNRQGSQANWHKNSSVLRTLRLSTFFLCILL